MPQCSLRSKPKKSSTVSGVNATAEDFFNGCFNVNYLKTIGSGYTSTVVKCVFPGESDQDVVAAAKVMSKNGVKRKYFHNEVQLLRRSTNMNIVEFIMALECLDSYIIMTEYCGQGDLHGKLRDLDDGFVMAREYMIGVISGLQCLHNNLITHLDIKMKNILISDTNVPKLADFGFALKMHSHDETLKVCNGTKDYWAPEMLETLPNYNPFMADIYALGVTFVGVCLKKPVKRKHDNIYVIVKSFTDRNQRELFKGVLDTNPNERWSLDIIRTNSWLYECITPPASPR